MASSAAQNEVSWQTAYWALVPLAINVMVQPCGRVCGRSPRHRMYLRASPVVCAVDLLAFMIRFAVLIVEPCFVRRKVRRGSAFRRALKSKGMLVEEEPVGIQALEKRPVLRFMLFVWALVQAIKILGCRGVPWTTAAAYCYIVPWVVFEVIGIMSAFVKTADGLSEEGAEPAAMQRNDNSGLLDEILDALELDLAWLADFAHMILLIRISARLGARYLSDNDLTNFQAAIWTIIANLATVLFFVNGPSVMKAVFDTQAATGVTETNVTAGTKGLINRLHHKVLGRHFKGLPSPVFPWIFAMLISEIPLAYKRLNSQWWASPARPGWDRVFWYNLQREMLMALHLMFLTLVPAAFSPLSCVRTHLLLLPNDTIEDLDEIYNACKRLVVFLATVVYATLGYAHTYDPADTYKPEWTNYFG